MLAVILFLNLISSLDTNRRMSKDVLNTDKLNDKRKMSENNERKNTQETMVALVPKDESENSKESLQPNGSNKEIQDREQKTREKGKNENGV